MPGRCGNDFPRREVFGAVVVVHGVVLDDDFLTLAQVCGEFGRAEFFYLLFFFLVLP